MELEILPARQDQEAILANLLELYIHDFSAFVSVEPGPDGRFGYPELPLYWEDPSRYPFLFRAEAKWAGLALVRQIEEPTRGYLWDMAEFFILRGYRRQQMGTQAARELWKRFPGAWQIRTMKSNQPAQRFWMSATAECVGGMQSSDFEKEGRAWSRLFFNTYEPGEHSARME